MAEARSRITAEVDFEKDGQQRGFLRLFHSVHASAYGFIPIPVAVFRNGAGPTALLVAGNHGDEYEGQVALCNLIRTLRASDITGRVIVLPTANAPAALAGRRTSPIDEGNLNRVFPGAPYGSVTEQIAYYIATELLPLADVSIDLHSGGSSLTYVPSALIRRDPDPALLARMLAALRAFGAPHAYVSIDSGGTGADRTLSGVARGHGVVALGTELGGGGLVGREALRIAERGIRNVLVHAGILPRSARIELDGPTRMLDVGGPDYFVYSRDAGVFEPVAEPGEMVAAGQLAGRIHTPETPWAAPAEVHFARDGFVLCKRVPGRTARGDCLFHLGTDSDL